MKLKKIIIAYISLSVVVGIGSFVYKKYFGPAPKLPYKTEKAKKRTIKRIIDTTGQISVSEKIKIGSLVTGTVKKLYVNENETVKKGQLLAEIDTGKDDADVRDAQGVLEQRAADFQYYKRYYERNKALYQSGQLAANTFEQIERDYRKTKGALLSAEANLYRAKRAFEETKFFSPQDGIIIRVGVNEGERVTTDLNATVLFEIAKDITKMEATLEIDEGDVGHAKVNQDVQFTVDSFPNKKFKSNIKEIGFSPKARGTNRYYEAMIDIDNSERLLRPGFTVDAKIFVAKAENVLSITSQAFMISSKVLKEVAKDLKYSFHPVDKKVLRERKNDPEKAIQTVWVIQRNGKPHSFVEKIVETDLTDDIHYEIVSGLDPDDEIVVDIEESNYLEEMFKKAFGAKF